MFKVHNRDEEKEEDYALVRYLTMNLAPAYLPAPFSPHLDCVTDPDPHSHTLNNILIIFHKN
jgi:hypothetical protein